MDTNDIQNAHKFHLYLSESVAPESAHVPNLDSSALCIPDDEGVAICCVIDDLMFVALGLTVRCLRLRVGA